MYVGQSGARHQHPAQGKNISSGHATRTVCSVRLFLQGLQPLESARRLAAVPSTTGWERSSVCGAQNSQDRKHQCTTALVRGSRSTLDRHIHGDRAMPRGWLLAGSGRPSGRSWVIWCEAVLDGFVCVDDVVSQCASNPCQCPSSGSS